MKKILFYMCVSLYLASSTLPAQNSISLSNRGAKYMDFKPSYNAGVSKQIITDDTQWLNYTTLVDASDPTISISVEIANGNIPEGMELQIEASNYRGKTKGKAGVPIRKVSVSHMPRVLIDNIGTCYTGSGRYEGHQITMSFIIKDYSKVQSGIHSIDILYTITQ